MENIEANRNLYYEINKRINSIKDKRIHNANNYLGSMFTFEIGEKITKFTKRKNIEYICGEVSIGIRDCFWKILNNDTIVLSSEDELNNQIMSFLNEYIFDKIEINNFSLTLHFNHNLKIVCDLSNQAKLEFHEDEDNTIIIVSLSKENMIYEIDIMGNVSCSKI